jgi:hypothetical protein
MPGSGGSNSASISSIIRSNSNGNSRINSSNSNGNSNSTSNGVTKGWASVASTGAKKDATAGGAAAAPGRRLASTLSRAAKAWPKPERVIPTEDDKFAQAGLAILEADHLLIAAGAGFSADSGLPVYKVGLSSHDAMPYQDHGVFQRGKIGA